MPSMTLVLGNKCYSSWSLRPWLALQQTNADCVEIVIPLDQPDTAARIGEYSPSGKVPVLIEDDIVVWESLAIIEYLAERFPDAGLWPEDPAARALARAVSAEMHAGFATLRTQMPMNLRRRGVPPSAPRSAGLDADIARVVAIWAICRERFGGDGPFLFGDFTAADAMFAPVVTRFASYAVDLDPLARAYADAILEWPALVDWYAEAKAEPWTISKYEAV